MLLCCCFNAAYAENGDQLSASQTVTATLTRTPPPPGPTPGPGGGAAVGIAAGGVAAAGAGAFAAAPLLLAGLTPNSVVYAAAPISCLPCVGDFLQVAMINHFGTKTYVEAIEQMNKVRACKFYLAQNNSTIINGTFDIQTMTIPQELLNAKRIRANVTIASQPYKESHGEPDLTFGLFNNISKPSLTKKFETQQFLHHYLMKKYEVPLRLTGKQYNIGFQKLTGVIDMTTVQNKTAPMHIVLRYTENGFKKNLRQTNPKTLIYAYLIELEAMK